MTDLSRKDQLIKLVMQIVPSQMKHHAEAEACDLLMEVERLDVLQQFVHEVSNFSLLEFFKYLPNIKLAFLLMRADKTLMLGFGRYHGITCSSSGREIIRSRKFRENASRKKDVSPKTKELLELLFSFTFWLNSSFK